MNLSEVLRGLINVGIKEIKLFLEHHQTVDIHARALQVTVRELFSCPSTNLISNFKF